jgi:hypothetical protein
MLLHRPATVEIFAGAGARRTDSQGRMDQETANAIAFDGQRKVNPTAVGATWQSTRKVRHLSAGLPGSSPA